MLRESDKKDANSYAFVNGMRNVAYVVGQLVKVEDGVVWILQTSNRNLALPIHFDPRKVNLPREVKEGSLVMAYCHVAGQREGESRVAKLRCIRFDLPNVMHMDKRFAHDMMRKWHIKSQEVGGVPSNEPQPAEFDNLERQFGKPSTERMDAFAYKAQHFNQNAANMVKVAGFVQAKSLERNRVNAEGKPVNDRLVVLIRQTEDPDGSIPVRFYGKNLEPLSNLLTRGLPLLVSGEFHVDVKVLGPADPESGETPVSRMPYIKAKDLPAPVDTDSDEIKIIPPWANDLLAAYGTAVAKQARSADAPAPAAAAAPVVAEASSLFAQSTQA